MNAEVTIAENSDMIGRIRSSRTGANNYARSDMVLRKNTAGGGTVVTPTIGATTKDGANVAQIDFNGGNSGTWWSSTVNAPGFSTTHWSLANGRLPRLNGFPGLSQPY